MAKVTYASLKLKQKTSTNVLYPFPMDTSIGTTFFLSISGCLAYLRLR